MTRKLETEGLNLMDRNQKIAATRRDMKTLKAEEEKLLGLVSLPDPDVLLSERLRAVTRMMRVLSDKLLELELKQG